MTNKELCEVLRKMRHPTPAKQLKAFLNLYMRQFADAYPEFEIAQQPVAQIPWGLNVLILTKLKDNEQRLWYAQKTIEGSNMTNKTIGEGPPSKAIVTQNLASLHHLQLPFLG